MAERDKRNDTALYGMVEEVPILYNDSVFEESTNRLAGPEAGPRLVAISKHYLSVITGQTPRKYRDSL
ncbi:MAG: hypothetical protein LBR86_01055 [Tannerella sp.]|jgi:hypothetical protein|nr:hypothetical protein [Tannerella sp.]